MRLRLEIMFFGLTVAAFAPALGLAKNTDAAIVTIRGKLLAPVEITQSNGEAWVPTVWSSSTRELQHRLNCAIEGECARLDVSGEPGLHFSIDTSSATTDVEGVTFEPECLADNGSASGLVGANSVLCGGTLITEPLSQGAYSAEFVVSITYDSAIRSFLLAQASIRNFHTQLFRESARRSLALQNYFDADIKSHLERRRDIVSEDTGGRQRKVK